MAEIDNSLAAKIQVPQIDIMNPLMKAAQYRNLQAEGGLKEQELGHRQFLYNQGGGYDPAELHTRATTANVLSDLRGRAGSILAGDQSPAARQLALQTVKMHGVPVHPDMERAIMTGPAGDVKKMGENMLRGGQPASATIEQGGQPSYNRAYGQRSGELSGGLAPAPGSGGTAQAGGEAPPPVPLAQKSAFAAGQAEADKRQLEGYRNEADRAGTIKATLQQIREDASRVRTGFGAEKEQGARKLLVALGDIVPGLKETMSKAANQTAAFESIDKNAGIVAREAMKGVGGTAASELDAISKSLVSGNTTNKGIEVNASQLIGMQNYNAARAMAADKYAAENGTLNGFVTKFNKNSGPAAWIYISLPSEERQAIRDNLNKTKEGKSILTSLGRQMHHIRENGLAEGLD